MKSRAFMMILAVCSFLVAAVAVAEQLKAELSLEGVSKGHWFILAEDAGVEFKPASVRRISGKAVLSSEVGLLSKEALVAPLLADVDGAVASGNLDFHMSGLFEKESQAALRDQLKKQLNLEKELSTRIEQIKVETEQARFELREQAGLSELNVVYAELGAIRAERLNFENILQQLEELTSAN